MTPETWTRGTYQPVKYLHRIVYSDGTTTPWTARIRTTGRGRSAVVTSCRGTPETALLRSRGYRRRGGYMFSPDGLHTVRIKRMPMPFSTSERGTTWLVPGEVATVPVGQNSYEFQGNMLSVCMDLKPPVYSINTSSIEDDVASELYQKASEPVFDSVLQVGEALEAVKMLKNPLSMLRGSADLFHGSIARSTRGLRGKDYVEAATGTWLEVAFGIAPVIQGTAEIANNLVAMLTPGEGEPTRIYSGRDLEVVEQSQSSYIVPPTHPYARLWYEKQEVLSGRVRGGFWLGCYAGEKILAKAGLASLRQIVAQAYELMPLSFALDWFVGLGPLLKECRPTSRRIDASWRSTTLQRKTRYVSSHLDNTYPYYGKAPFFSVVETLYKSHTRITGVHPPGQLGLGKGLRELSNQLNLAALMAGPMSTLWSKHHGTFKRNIGNRRDN